MKKIVINKFYGGFFLSSDILSQYKDKTGDWKEDHEIDRHDPVLVGLVEDGIKSGEIESLGIVEIPDGVDYVIKEYDGAEWVAERHRVWHYRG